jgi:hypothetical protein
MAGGKVGKAAEGVVVGVVVVVVEGMEGEEEEEVEGGEAMEVAVHAMSTKLVMAVAGVGAATCRVTTSPASLKTPGQAWSERWTCVCLLAMPQMAAPFPAHSVEQTEM